ncbi:metal-dependent hydrolase [Halogeometricum limi]|uniref:LexA-binding, inner membrane-associated putative hydrolase n=1 Tax=Halogeometricum limi TaxID=555875 RepID=A0A1I6IEB2_9EURY|nr:metal-dependent hydrolase [Halogeometricum limi]SFR65036.1 LexA-binding, inner membrane-associated putative hydrolase [Halogeometricum limi]
MLPWGHAGFGYLLYSALVRARTGRPPTGPPVLGLVLGTQFPDLVDKPAAWTFDVLASGRSLGHSVFTFAILMGVLWAVFDTPRRRALVAAFGVGYGSHLVGDALAPVVQGESENLGYLLWPLLPGPTDHNTSFLEFFLSLQWTPFMLFGFAVAFASVVVWMFDGMPGVTDLFALVSSADAVDSADDR